MTLFENYDMGEAEQKVAYGATEMVTYDTQEWYGYVERINEDNCVKTV